ncbi:MAG: hypothetical protein RJP95_04600 [Pirellulales bacterium]
MAQTNYRTLHVRVSREAHTRARIAALESDLSFRDYIDRLLRTAQPIKPTAITATSAISTGDHHTDT